MPREGFNVDIDEPEVQEGPIFDNQFDPQFTSKAIENDEQAEDELSSEDEQTPDYEDEAQRIIQKEQAKQAKEGKFRPKL